jgi:ribonucleotide reductase beta subunit family protein with ferritin-like domain/glutaredoxin
MSSIFEDSKSYRPFKYPYLMEAVETHTIDLYWDSHQLDFSDDIKQYHSKDGLKTDNVSHEVNKDILTKTLNLFTQMDVAAGELYCQLLPWVKNNEVRNWFMVAAARESTHQRCYAAAVESLDFPESSWTEFMEYKEMQGKLDVMYGDISTSPSTHKGFMKTLARLFLAEGICLFGAFASMLNLRRFGLMAGTNKVNEWSLRDEEEHVKNNIKIFLSELENFSKEDKLEIIAYVKKITKAFVEAENLFLDLVYSLGDQEGTTKEDMKGYIKYLANVRIKTLGWSPLYPDEPNPLPWMDWVLSGKKHTNFFEERVTDYSHDPLKGNVDYNGYLLQEKSEIKVKLNKPVGLLTVYSADWCSYCKKLKTALDDNFINYEVIDVDTINTFEHKTIPQVFLGDKHIGGCDDTLKYLTK